MHHLQMHLQQFALDFQVCRAYFYRLIVLFFLQAKYQSKKSVIVNLSRSPTTRSDPSEFSNDSVTNVTSSSTTVTATATAVLNDPGSSGEPNILQVYAAYDTGLASGTSVKLTVTKDTTAREVIDLVIKQLNMAVILKGINLKITLCILCILTIF